MPTYSLQKTNGADVASQTTSYDNSPAAVVVNGDGSGVAFYANEANAGSLYGRLFDSAGEPYGNEILIASGTYEYGYASATVLSNGNIAVTWMGDTSDTILARIYTPTLQPVSGVTTVFDRTFAMKWPDIVATPGGGFVIAAEYDLSATDTDVYVKMFNSAGTALQEQAYTPGSSLDGGPSVAVLSNGNIVLYWTRTFSSADPEIWRAIYSSSLGVVSAPAKFLSDASSPVVTARPDGSFMLTYFNGSVDLVSRTVSATGGQQDSSTLPYKHSFDGSTSWAGHTIGIVQGGYGPSSSLTAQLTLPNGTIIDDVMSLPDTIDDLTGESPIIAWVNSYTVQVAFRGYTYQGKDGLELVRYRVVATTAGSSVADTMIGDALADLMTGDGGNDTMNGGVGPDTMRGGTGNDVYYVDDFGDIVDEIAAGSDGWDTVYSAINYFLPTGVEALALIGSASVGAWGNAGNNALSGNAADNILDGSFGADTMTGGAGNDIYYVDQKGDFIDEYTPGSSGFDTVYSSINYTLGVGLEGLRLMGDLKLDGTGNGLGNLIVGNVAANVLKGGGGADTIMGSIGKDTIDGGAGKDIADYSDKAKPISVDLNGSSTVTVKVKGKAEDKIKNVEGVIGSQVGDKITGDSKDNILNGYLGKDTLKGEGGKDQFVFNALGPANADKISDFKHNTDKIALEDWVFWSIGPALEKAEFYAKAGATKAHDADDRIIYNKTNGNLYYDADGKGGAAAVLFATLSNKPSLDHGDFVIV